MTTHLFSLSPMTRILTLLQVVSGRQTVTTDHGQADHLPPPPAGGTEMTPPGPVAYFVQVEV